MSGSDTSATRKVGKSTGNRGLGRKKGVPNKITGALKEMILKALDEAGGVDYLVKQADESPNAFLALVGKVLPLTLAGDANSPIQVIINKPGAQ